MDKENNNNIEDILKLLKNTVENTADSSAEPFSTKEETIEEQLNPELLKERLREQFMSGEEKAEESNGEYTIDKDLISEFYDESAKTDEEMQIISEEDDSSQEEEVFENPAIQTSEEAVNEEIDEVDAEDLSAKEGEIVEIVIPWVDAIEEGVAEDSEIDDFGGDAEDEIYDEDSSENSYICFADETVSDEDILLGEEKIEQEEVEIQELEEPDFEETHAPQNEAEAVAEDDGEDDLPPWIEDDIPTPKTESVVESIVVEDTTSYQEDIPQETEEELLDNIDIVEETFVDVPLEQEDASVMPEEEKNGEISNYVTPQNLTDKVDDREEMSFYRTMIEAREELESSHGYPRTSANDVAQTEPENIEQDLELPYFDDSQEPLLEDFDESSASDKETKTDFYGEDEHYADIQEDRVYTEEQKTDELDFDEEISGGGNITEKLAGSVWGVIKPVLLGVIALAVFAFEMIPIVGIVPGGIFDYTSYTWTYILIDTQLLIFSVALCYEKIFDGLRKIFTPEANFYSLLSVGAIVALLNNIISCFSANDVMPRLYSFIIVAYILVMCIIEKQNAKRIKDSLVELETQEVFSLRRSQGKNSCAEKMYMGGVDPDTSILEPVQIKSESFDSAFAREEATNNKSWHNSIVFSSVIPAVIFAIFMAVIVTAFDFGLLASINAFTFVFVSIAPLSAVISYYLPIFISYRRLRDRGCYITGYDGAYEMSDCDAVVFNDCHLFKACSAKEAGIKLYCSDARTRQLFVALAAVYSKVGGPMKDTFSSVLGDEAHNVNMIRITRNGFEAVVDGRVSLIVGSSDYLARYGIVTDRSDAKDPGVIFAALNSVLSAKISVKYRTQPLFEELCAMLDEHGMRCVIETYDPVVSGKFVARCREMDSKAVSVVHKNVNDYNMPPNEKASIGKFGAFATSSRLRLVELVIFCKRLTSLRKINTGILIASYVAVAAFSILLAIGGSIEKVNLLWVLIYQAILIAIYAISAVKFLPLSFDAEQEKKEREEIKKQEKENRN